MKKNENKLVIGLIRNHRENKINEKIDNIKDPNISEFGKRLKVLSEMKLSATETSQTSIYFPDNQIPLFNVEEVRGLREKKIEEKIINIQDKLLSYIEKRLNVLDELNTSLSSNGEEEENTPKEVSKETYFEDEVSTTFSSTVNILDEQKTFWVNNFVYDAIKKDNSATLFEIDNEKYCFLYKNNLVTYSFSKNINFGEDYKVNDEVTLDKDYNESLNLFFCGKKFEYENEDLICRPNEFMCKDCMEKSRKRHALESKYAININGRAAKRNKEGNFHCFGHFCIGNKIEICVKKFTCEACLQLSKYENYYFKK